MSFRLVHAAGNMFMSTSKREQVYTKAATLGDVLTFSEAQKDRAAIQSLSGFDALTVGELAIVWRSDRFVKVDHGYKVVMLGGKRGGGGSNDRRRRGPNRLVLWAVLRDTASDDEYLIFTHHSIAKADTSALWRRGLRAEGFRNTAFEVTRAGILHPDALVIGTGDWNTKGSVNLGIGLREIPTPATFGRLRYDRLQVSPGVAWSNVSTATTAGDHRALIATITPTGEPVTAPRPITPTKVPPKGLNAWQRRRYARLMKIVRNPHRRLKSYQRKALANLRRLKGN